MTTENTGLVEVTPSREEVERAHAFLRSLRKPTINSNVPASVAVQAMFYWHQQETKRERESADMAGLAHTEVIGEVDIHSSGDGSDSRAVLGSDSARSDDNDGAGTLEVATPAPVEPGSEREALEGYALFYLPPCGDWYVHSHKLYGTVAHAERAAEKFLHPVTPRMVVPIASAILARPAADGAK